MKLVTLILVTPTGERAEYSLFCCCRLPKTFLIDLYTLYVGKEQVEELLPEYVQSVTSLQVDTILEPSLWLDCLKWSRFRREEDKACLEIFVSRPKKSELYYAVGSTGALLIGKGHTIRIHESTVKILCGESKSSCSNPKRMQVDWKANEDKCKL